MLFYSFIAQKISKTAASLRKPHMEIGSTSSRAFLSNKVSKSLKNVRLSVHASEQSKGNEEEEGEKKKRCGYMENKKSKT